jgi:hypothetical protein
MKTLTTLYPAVLFVAVTLMGLSAPQAQHAVAPPAAGPYVVAQGDSFVYEPNYTCSFTRTPSGFRDSCGPQVQEPTECPEGRVLVKMLSYGLRSARCVPVEF